MSLSLASIEEYQKMLQEYAKEIPKVAQNIVDRLSEEGLKNNYKSTVKIATKNEGDRVVGGIKTTEEKDTYKEFGTGIVGSNSPHIAEWLAEAGWKYDVNEHGEKGWIYPKSDGSFGWTKGIPANKKFYIALQEMEKKFPEIAKEEFQKIIKG